MYQNYTQNYYKEYFAIFLISIICSWRVIRSIFTITIIWNLHYVLFAALNPCDKWPENYFEKYHEPNETLVEEMYKYGRKNLALIHVMIQSPYFTKIKRDVAMTFTTYIANSGGLLGLCLGFSFMSGIEIIFCLCWLF